MKNKGFTLIELLVVIAIIGVLATIVTSSLSSARIKAQDAKRIATMRNLETALEFYYADNGDYPHLYTNTYNTGVNISQFKTAMFPYINIDLDDLLFGPHSQTGTAFYYHSTSGDNYQTYGVMMKLIDSSNSNIEQSDGGYWSTYYEIGQKPRYCMDKYNGTWHESGTTVCTGGN